MPDHEPTDDAAALADAAARNPRLDPLRHAIGEMRLGHDRVGVLTAEVEVSSRTEGLFRKKRVDVRETVVLEVFFDPWPVDADGEQVDLPWVDNWLEADDRIVTALLNSRFLYPGQEHIAVRWLDGAEADLERRRLTGDLTEEELDAEAEDVDDEDGIAAG